MKKITTLPEAREYITVTIRPACEMSLELSKRAVEGPWYEIDTFGPSLSDIAAPDVPGEGSPNVIASVLWGAEGLSASEAESVAKLICHARTICPLAAQATLTAIDALEKIQKESYSAWQHVDAVNTLITMAEQWRSGMEGKP